MIHEPGSTKETLFKGNAAVHEDSVRRRLSPKESSLYRLWALERLGHQVIPFNTFDYLPRNPFVSKVTLRLSAGPSVNRLNRDLLRAVEAEKPDLLWTDKLLSMRSKTIDRIRERGIATVSYMIDNPFGTRRDSGWRLYMKNIPHYDLHVVQRDKNILDYTAHGARDVIKIQTAYEPTLHFPPPQAGPTQTATARSPSSARPMTTAPRPLAGSGASAASISTSPEARSSGASHGV